MSAQVLTTNLSPEVLALQDIFQDGLCVGLFSPLFACMPLSMCRLLFVCPFDKNDDSFRGTLSNLYLRLCFPKVFTVLTLCFYLLTDYFFCYLCQPYLKKNQIILQMCHLMLLKHHHSVIRLTWSDTLKWLESLYYIFKGNLDIKSI